MRKKIYEKARDFLDSFAAPLDYDQLREKVDCLSQLVCEDYGIKDKFLRCAFEEDKKFGKTASISDTLISINKLRIEAILALAFDDTHPRRLKSQICSFMKSYGEKKKHSLYEQMLYNFVCEMKEMDAEELVLQAGSFKTLKFDFLDIVFHENRHTVQKTYIPLLEKPAKELAGKDFVLLFTMLYNEMHNELIDAQKIEWDYQDNSTFPIEFDARYTSLVHLNNIRRLFYPHDKLFAKFIVRSCLVRSSLPSQKTAADLFQAMEHYHSLADFGKYAAAHDLVLGMKEQVRRTLAQRFEEMKSIVQENRAIYSN